MSEEYYNKKPEKVIEELGSSEKGLSEKEAGKRLEKYGLNEITEGKKISPMKIFARQFRSFIVYILVVAVIISAAVPVFEKGLQNTSAEDFIDSIAIIVILVLNGIMGFLQEYRAEKAIEALKRLASPHAFVIRDRREKEIDAKNVVPGDIVSLSTGQKVPADCRLISFHDFQTQEASLTGESTPVQKSVDAIKGEKVIANRINMAFAGTDVTRGSCHAVVTATGMSTEIGKIAKQIQDVEQKTTPLQSKLAGLAEVLGIITIIICIAVVAGGILKGGSALEWLIIGISLAVAAIPEGLPAVVTISLALGVQKMAKRNSLVRKLPSVETLGSTTVICTDKTGTLTKNEMTVRKIYAGHRLIDVSGSGYHTEGKFSLDGKEFKSRELETVLKIGALCNDSRIYSSKVIGDPTEASLLVSAEKYGIKIPEIKKELRRVADIEFTSERKMMSTLHRSGKKSFVFSKGAPDILLKKCVKISENGKIRKITKDDRKAVLEANKKLASSALRVLGFAYRESSKLHENDLIFAGLQAMMDPPRQEAKIAVKKCRDAGIRVIMITGDHEITAKAVASELGIDGESLTGERLKKIKDLASVIGKISVFARVNPEDKIMIVEALQKKGEVVAMTGDGVNDAPALKKADIGISMGKSGTDVAKEASDMILTDDNFASVVGAVEEGRGIFDNIKKFVNYLLSSNMGEVLVLFTAMIIGFTYEGAPVLPLVAIQILWINLVTDGLPALALGVDPTSPGVMKRPPRNPKERIVSENMAINIGIIGVLMATIVLFLFSTYIPYGIEKAQTIAFTSIVVLEFARVYIIRSGYGIGFFSNTWLIAAIGVSLLLQAFVIYTPFLNSIFRTAPIGAYDWLLMAGMAVAMFATGMILQKSVKVFTHERD